MSWADAIGGLIATLDERGDHVVALDPSLVHDVTACAAQRPTLEETS